MDITRPYSSFARRRRLFPHHTTVEVTVGSCACKTLLTVSELLLHTVKLINYLIFHIYQVESVDLLEIPNIFLSQECPELLQTVSIFPKRMLIYIGWIQPMMAKQLVNAKSRIAGAK